MTETLDDVRWSSAWLDLFAFVGWLGVAWWGQWQATDLVWSLWLSSLVVGYTMIVWGLIRPVVDVVAAAAQDRTFFKSLAETKPAQLAMFGGIALLVGLLMLTFFTVHFGGFHYVHSQILEMFFPVDMGYAGRAHPSQMAVYEEIVRRYWIILPSAFLSHRAAFARRPSAPELHPLVTVEAIAARKMANRLRSPGLLTAPYQNVMRMHFLIFFFAFAHFAKLENFAVFATVYAVYFFPWRMVRSGAQATAPA